MELIKALQGADLTRTAKAVAEGIAKLAGREYRKRNIDRLLTETAKGNLDPDTMTLDEIVEYGENEKEFQAFADDFFVSYLKVPEEARDSAKIIDWLEGECARRGEYITSRIGLDLME